MPRKSDSLKHQLRVKVLDGVTDNDTRRAYRRASDAFAEWAKGKSIRNLSDVDTATIQAYERYLEARPEHYTPATIHGKLAPICKATDINMKEIQKPKRTASKIQRGRTETKTGRGEREEMDPRYGRLVDLQKAVGIRRAELAKLTGKDWDGKYLTVSKGKGGKRQRQFVLPEHRDTVNRIFSGVAPDERVFSGEEMQNHINIHKMRAQVAKDAYDYYSRIMDGKPELRERMRSSLLKRWEAGHERMAKTEPDHYKRARQHFIKDMDDRGLRLRGENLKKALNLGLPTEYDRLALMAVSVFHLSHWRNDVTVINYLIQ